MNDSAATHPQGVRVTVRGLRRSFDGQPVLKGLNFEVERGEIFVVMGPSGSGKSVLLKHIIGLETPDAGEILIEGESIQSPGVMDKYRMAMVFQSGALFSSLTIGIAVRIALMHDGQILAGGAPDDGKNNPHSRVQEFLTAKFNRNMERTSL